jgi:hypothetical protein
MKRHLFTNDQFRVIVLQNEQADVCGYFIASVELRISSGWQRILTGIDGQEFSTSAGAGNATSFEFETPSDRGWVLRLATQQASWQASEVITLDPHNALLRREQCYRFLSPCDGAVHPGWQVQNTDTLRYTFPLRAHETAMAGLPALRSDIAWALPFPFHVWHDTDWVALYGLDKRTSAGTLDFLPPAANGQATLRVYHPDVTEQPPGFTGLPQIPQQTHYSVGDEVTLQEIVAAKVLTPGQEPLLEAERIAAGLLLSPPWPDRDLRAVAGGIADYYRHCDLWEPNALGPGLGWFLNMWTYTQAGTPQRKGPGAGYFDFGWGEGIAAEIFVALLRHWNRTGSEDQDLLTYVDQMSRGMQRFQRSTGPDEPYFDRFDGEHFGDFMLNHLPPGRRIWTHSLGHTGSQLVQAYREGQNYPDPQVRTEWLAVAQTIGRYFARLQQPNGDLPDIVDDEDRELNRKPHRIVARAVVCGLWTKLAEVTGEHGYIDRAQRLARAVEPELEAYAFYNQMIDGLASPDVEYMDGEGAYYVLEGLAPLYAVTRDPLVLSLCQKAAAFGIAWTYFFDLPHAHNGIARGGQCCRMPDFPLLYPIGPAKAVEPLLSLYESTGDAFYERMAHEMVRFIGEYQRDCPGKPWHGGMIHAIDQSNGKHWGPDKCGQVDTGMATGNSLASIELWLAHASRS